MLMFNSAGKTSQHIIRVTELNEARESVICVNC